MKNENLLLKPLFLTSVILLLLNDFYFKYEYYNYFTGKLSDFVGLFAFPYFVSIFLKKRIKTIYIITGILFVFWKSSYSQLSITFLNDIGIGVNRVVDYTDLMALLILPFSFKYRKQTYFYEFKRITILIKPLIIGVTIFSFLATSMPRMIKDVNLKSNLEIKIELSKKEILNRMFSVSRDLNNEKYKTFLFLPKKNANIFISVIVEKIDSNSCYIKLDSIKKFEITGGMFFGVRKNKEEYLNSLELKDYEKLFIEQKILKLY